MRLCAISDTHGLHSVVPIKQSDVLCIAGDISPLLIQDKEEEMLKWIREEFLSWCEKQPVETVLLTPGNHDWVIYKREKKVKELFKGTKVKCLIDEQAFCAGHSFWGTPWCSVFGNWAYMKSPEAELKTFMAIPEGTDVLITHDPPYGVCDTCKGYPSRAFTHLGNKELAKALETKGVKNVVCGHIHTGNEHEKLFENTEVYNVSVVNEQYRIYREPLYLEI